MRKPFAAILVSLLFLAGCGKEGPLESLNELSELEDVTQAVGRQITMTDVSVTDVPGAVLFWVTDQGTDVPVVLANELAGGDDDELKIRAGQIRTITGTIRLVASAADDDPMWDLIEDTPGDPERTRVEDAKIYVLADSVK